MNTSTLLMVALMIVAFYFLILRPQKKRAAAAQQLVNSLQPGTRVLLGSGIFGEIIEVGDRQAVVEVAPGVELTVLKQAIARVATAADEDTVVADDTDLDSPGYVDDLDRSPEPVIEPAVAPASVPIVESPESPVRPESTTRPENGFQR